MARLQRRDIGSADEVRELPKGVLRLFAMADGAVGWSSFESGWRWSKSVKPFAGNRALLKGLPQPRPIYAALPRDERYSEGTT